MLSSSVPYSTLLSYTLSLPLLRFEDVPRAVVSLILTIFSCWLFSLHLRHFWVGGLSNHNTFSTSAVICALGKRDSDRNRVYGLRMSTFVVFRGSKRFTDIMGNMLKTKDICSPKVGGSGAGRSLGRTTSTRTSALARRTMRNRQRS